MAFNIYSPQVSSPLDVSRLAQQILETGLTAPVQRRATEQNIEASKQQIASQRLQDLLAPQEMQLKERELEANIKNQELMRQLQAGQLGMQARRLGLEEQQFDYRATKDAIKRNLTQRLSSMLLGGGEAPKPDAGFVGAMPENKSLAPEEVAKYAMAAGEPTLAKSFIDLAKFKKSTGEVDKTFLIERPDGVRETFYGTKEQAKEQGKVLGATSRPDLNVGKNEYRELNIPEFELADPENVLPDATMRRNLTQTYSSFKSFNNGLIPQLKNIIEDVGTELMPTSKARVKLKNLYAQYKLDYKEIYKLGALQEGEIALLNDVLLNPTTASLENIVSDKAFALASIDQFSNNLKDKVKNDFLASGYRPKEGNPLYAGEENGSKNIIPEESNNVIDFNDY